MQGLKVLPSIVDKITRVNEPLLSVLTDQWTHRKPNAYVAPCQQVRQNHFNMSSAEYFTQSAKH